MNYRDYNGEVPHEIKYGQDYLKENRVLHGQTGVTYSKFRSVNFILPAFKSNKKNIKNYV